MSIQTLCIFCGSKKGQNPIYADIAAAMGRDMASKGVRLVYGGGSVGLMGVIADACLEAGGEVIGVITEQLMDLELGHKGLTQLYVVDTMLDRKSKMADLADAFISIPGSVGTLDELFEMLTWTQLEIHAKPSGLLNINGYYDDLLAMINKLVAEEFLSQTHANQLHVGTTFDILFSQLEKEVTP